MSDMTVANTIFDQLGGRRFAVMTGSKNFLGDSNSLTMKLARGTKNKATHLKVTLDAMDTYTMDFMACRAGKVTSKGSFEGIYADQLASMFESETGLYTKF